MKVVLVHDYIKEYGGAERVLETLHELYPDAPIYTSVFYPQFLGPHRKRFEKMQIHTSWLQYLPFGYKFISPFRLVSPWVFKHFDLSSYDVIIVSQTGAYFPNFVKKGHAKLLTYTHTPPRYLYGYKTAREWKNNPVLRVLGELANHFLRLADFRASQNVDQFIANSEEVKARIKKFYRKDAIVVYPPVLIFKKSETYNLKSKTYYLAGGRLARAKGMDVIIDAFVKNGKSLKIFGKGFAGYEEELRVKIDNKKSKIEFVGEVSDEEKMTLMQNAKAYVFASYDEDFGITPVEAMSLGTPVITYKSGGVKETVIEGETGMFYEPNTPEALERAVEQFEKMNLRGDDCKKQAQKFAKEQFIKRIEEVVRSVPVIDQDA
jgi:glycosyltransferase involved in cell wall biosynthesis